MTNVFNKAPKAAFDIAKTVIILFIVFVHTIGLLVLNSYASEELIKLAEIISALSVFGAPMFFVCFGVDMYENRSYKNLIKTGIQLLLIGLIFNFLRFNVSNAVWLLVDEGPLGWIFYPIFASDIYGFVGLFSIVYGLCKKYKLNNLVIFLFSIITFILNLYLSTHPLMVSDAIGTFLGNFISGYIYGRFSLLGWSIFPCIGLLLGKITKNKTKKRNMVFGLILIISIICLAICIYLLPNYGTSAIEVLSMYLFYGNYGIPEAVLMVCLSLITLIIFYLIYELVPENKVEKVLINNANLILPYYFIHYIVLYWLIIIPMYILYGFGVQLCINIWQYILICMFIEITSLILCYKKGYSFSRWLFRITNYSKWFKKKAQ